MCPVISTKQPLMSSNEWYLQGSECNFEAAEVLTTQDPSNLSPLSLPLSQFSNQSMAMFEK